MEMLAALVRRQLRRGHRHARCARRNELDADTLCISQTVVPSVGHPCAVLWHRRTFPKEIRPEIRTQRIGPRDTVRRAGQASVMVADKHLHGRADLTHIRQALRRMSLAEHGPGPRVSERSEHRDDGHDDEQLDQGKSRGRVFHRRNFLRKAAPATSPPKASRAQVEGSGTA